VSGLGTAYLLARIDQLTHQVDDLRAEKDAALTALAATQAYGDSQRLRAEHAAAVSAEMRADRDESVARLIAEREELAAQLRARAAEVRALKADHVAVAQRMVTAEARLLIAQGGQI
jgi:hypothetical protein